MNFKNFMKEKIKFYKINIQNNQNKWKFQKINFKNQKLGN